MSPAATPTLLVFTLGAAGESARRGLLPESLKGLEIGLRQACLAAVLEAGESCGCRLEVCSPRRLAVPAGVRHVAQRSADFGSRFEGALAGAFARAGEGGSLMVVGTDVPRLGSRHLKAALALLAEDGARVVLGPSPDGGLYLLAAARPLPGLGSAVRWCRGETMDSLRRALAAGGRPVVLLESLSDLDRPADLDAWLAHPAAAADSDSADHALRASSANVGERWRIIARLLP